MPHHQNSVQKNLPATVTSPTSSRISFYEQAERGFARSMMVDPIQIISIGNDHWGPLNQKKGGTLRGLRIYHSIDNETNPPQATTEMIISFTVITYLQY